VDSDDSSADLQLVKRVQEGDRSAFDLLVRKYQFRVFHLVERYVKDPADVADVAQDAFIRAYRALSDFRGDCRFYTWLYRIAVNTAKNHIEHVKHLNEGVHLDQPHENIQIKKLNDEGTPERLALRDELEQAVVASIASLPEELKQALLLRELEGMSYEEIAQKLNCPVGTVRSRLFRAREVLEHVIKPLMGE